MLFRSCQSVTGLKSFESSYCVLKSPTRSDRKFYWMFCLVLINSLTVKSLFFGYVIFRNDMFLLSIFYLFEHGFEHGFNMFSSMILYMISNMVLNMIFNIVLNMVFKTVLNMNSSRNTNLISTKQFISFSFHITSFCKGHLRYYPMVIFHSSECFKLQ